MRDHLNDRLNQSSIEPSPVGVTTAFDWIRNRSWPNRLINYQEIDWIKCISGEFWHLWCANMTGNTNTHTHTHTQMKWCNASRVKILWSVRKTKKNRKERTKREKDREREVKKKGKKRRIRRESLDIPLFLFSTVRLLKKMKSEENGRSPGQTPLLRPGQTPGQTPLSSSTLEPPRPERARQLGTADIPARGCDHALRALQPTKPDGGSLPPSPLPWNPVIKSFGRISLSLSLFFSFSFFFLQITIIISCFFFSFLKDWIRIFFVLLRRWCGKIVGERKKKKESKDVENMKGGKMDSSSTEADYFCRC